MSAGFDPDALLAALPRREILPVPSTIMLRSSPPREIPVISGLGQKGEYNGFTKGERDRTAAISNWLVGLGLTVRMSLCDICGVQAGDEHAEDYYDLTSWIGLCRSCHRDLLHKRFGKPERWERLLDQHEVGPGHWTRLVAPQPFDLAALLRARGKREPTRMMFR